MAYLLDTHAFLWWSDSPEKLSQTVLDICQDLFNEVWLSVVSVWEIQIKVQLGKLSLKMPILDLVYIQNELNSIQILPIKLTHIGGLQGLLDYHRDPFDRLIVAQILQEGFSIISHDKILQKYPISVIW